MPNTKLLDGLQSIISEREKEGLTSISSLYCLIGSLYSAKEFNENFNKYIQNKEESESDNLLSNSIMVGHLIAKALKNKDLPQSFVFILESLYEITNPIQKKMIYLKENTPTLEEIKTPSDFIIKNLEEMCKELAKLKYPITHKNNERGWKIEAWWRENYKHQ
jgi:hypothetical protein